MLRAKNIKLGGLLVIVLVVKVVEEWRRDRNGRRRAGGGVIEVRDLTKRYGTTLAVDGLSFDVQPGRRDRLPRPERRRQVDDDADDPRPRPPDVRHRRRSTAGPTATLPAPMREVGALLDAKRGPRRPHGARAPALARARRRPAARRASTRCSRSSASPTSRTAASAASRSACRSGSASPPRCSATRAMLLFDEPINGLDPEGIRWIRSLLRDLAAEGRTVLVSSHVMSEMAGDRRPRARDRARPPGRRHAASPS